MTSSAVGSSGIHLRAISQEMLKIPIHVMKITNLTLQPHLLGGNEFMMIEYRFWLWQLLPWLPLLSSHYQPLLFSIKRSLFFMRKDFNYMLHLCIWPVIRNTNMFTLKQLSICRMKYPLKLSYAVYPDGLVQDYGNSSVPGLMPWSYFSLLLNYLYQCIPPKPYSGYQSDLAVNPLRLWQV